MAGDSQPSPMGSPKDANAPARLPNSKPAAASIASASPPEASPSAWPENSAHLAASAQTYYRTGGTQPAFFLPIWGGQHLVPLCGNPPIFSSMYASSAVYVHPSINPDEDKLKRRRRKLHNRESLIRSRLRNLQKTEELARKVAKLRGENAELRIELEQLHKVCKDIEAENHHISEKINNICEKSSSS